MSGRHDTATTTARSLWAPTSFWAPPRPRRLQLLVAVRLQSALLQQPPGSAQSATFWARTVALRTSWCEHRLQIMVVLDHLNSTSTTSEASRMSQYLSSQYVQPLPHEVNSKYRSCVAAKHSRSINHLYRKWIPKLAPLPCWLKPAIKLNQACSAWLTRQPANLLWALWGSRQRGPDQTAVKKVSLHRRPSNNRV